MGWVRLRSGCTDCEVAVLTSRWIDRLEVRTGENLTYARQIAKHSPMAFWKLALTAASIRHIGAVPTKIHHLARLGALTVEDCGPCVQTQAREALQHGVPRELLRAALTDRSQLSGQARDAFEFGRAVAGRHLLDDDLRRRIADAFGEQGLVDLTVAAATVRIFPALKRGLGHDRNCSTVEFEF